MTEKEILLSLVTKAYNKTETEINNLLYEVDEKGTVTGLKTDAAEQLINLDNSRVKTWKDRNTETIDKAVKEATGKAYGYYEGVIRDKFKLPAEKKGDELIAEMDNVLKQWQSGDGKGKNSKEYLELETRYKDIETKYKEISGKIGTEFIPKTEVERSSRLSMADKQAMNVISSMKLIKPESETIQQNLNKAFLNDLRGRYDDIEMTSDGKIFAFKDGKRIENAHGHAVTLDEIVREVALGYYQEAKQDPRGNAGNGGGGGNSGGANTQLSDIDKALADPNITWEQKAALYKQKQELSLKK